jgi:periplasmic divalent cation tolerance protein
MLIVLTTAPNEDQAGELADAIVRAKLAACVQVLPPMTSFYWWGDDMQKEKEHLLLIKTLPEKYDDLESFIRDNHSYEVPEIVALDSERVSEAYLAWMKDYLE